MGYIGKLWHWFKFVQSIYFKNFKFPWKNAKNHTSKNKGFSTKLFILQKTKDFQPNEKIRKLLAPSIFEIKKNVPDVCHTIFWFYRKIIIAQESSHKKKFFPEVGIRNFMTKSTRGGITRGVSPLVGSKIRI